MGHISSHVLDVAAGRPAVGIPVILYRLSADGTPAIVHQSETNEDGRTDAFPTTGVDAAVYIMEFHVKKYFRAKTDGEGDPPFFDLIPIRFTVARGAEKHHVPLLLGPWSYTVYRGS